MPNTTVRAAAEGMPAANLSRRSVLTGIDSIPAIAGAGTALALAGASETAAEASIAPALTAAPDERIFRLAHELSVAMNDFSLGAHWCATVYSPSCRPGRRTPFSFQQDPDWEKRQHDPLLEAIRAYRAGMADYNKHAPADNDAAEAYAEVSYGPPFDRLANWEEPAATLRLRIETTIENLVALLDEIDGEADWEDGADDEPYLAGTAGSTDDREDDPAESGKGDADGLDAMFPREAGPVPGGRYRMETKL